LNSIAHFFTQILFSLITPPLLIPWIAKSSITRLLILFCFGRLYGDCYEDIIDSFQGRYGLAMAEGLAKARKRIGDKTPVVVDCGTGTGFVTRRAAEHLSNATFIAFDMLDGMVTQARNNCKDLATHVHFLQADTFALPLADQSVDLLLAQNTIPWFKEFSRVCRPDGIILYVDTSAGWIACLARWLVSRNGLFESVKGERVDLGFYILAQPKRAV
jgi:SAM-dependent methyltransferase